jgi:hypothetical protein
LFRVRYDLNFYILLKDIQPLEEAVGTFPKFERTVKLLLSRTIFDILQCNTDTCLAPRMQVLIRVIALNFISQEIVWLLVYG